jgi:ribose-phosphate pyrophosphokinase
LQGFFPTRIPVENIRAIPIAVAELARENFHNPVIVAPHEDCMNLARDFRSGLELAKGQRVGVAMVIEAGSQASAEENVASITSSASGEALESGLLIVGEVEDCDVIIVDNILDTARSLCARARLLKKRGARRVFAYATHSLFSGEALRRIEASPIDALITTDTISAEARDHEHKFALARSRKIRRVSVAPLLAEAIERSHKCASLQHLRIFDRRTLERPGEAED